MRNITISKYIIINNAFGSMPSLKTCTTDSGVIATKEMNTDAQKIVAHIKVTMILEETIILLFAGRVNVRYPSLVYRLL
ncbi:MAG: hypothetical protein IKO84_01660 [Butyrivibrio sp.]|nr:hypothetical protein [Butyrivibrio sp.]